MNRSKSDLCILGRRSARLSEPSKTAFRLLLCLLVASVASLGTLAAAAAADGDPAEVEAGRVYTMTNSTAGNEIVVFSRAADGTLSQDDSIATGGVGTGAGLGNQGGIAISEDNQWLISVNAGSNDVSVFSVTPDGLELTDRESSRGQLPVSVALRGNTVYVLNADSNDVTGFFLNRHGRLRPLLASRRHLSGDGTAAAQVGFSPDGRTLMVTEKNTNLIVSYEVGFGGYLGRARLLEASGATPFGFAFGRRGQVFVTHAEGGAPGASTVGAYQIDAWSELHPITGAVPTEQAAACWLAVSFDKGYAYTTNTGSSSITGFRISATGELSLLDADGVTFALPEGSAPIDMAFTDDGTYLYALSGGSGSIAGFRIGNDGELIEVDSISGLPGGTNGLVAR